MSLSFEERKKVLLELLDLNGKVKVSEAEHLLKVSGETIRRDMDRMEKEGLLHKVYGGAMKVKEKFELTFEQKTSVNYYEKRIIAKAAASVVDDGDIIFIGHGTTAYEIVLFLTDKPNVTVVTNSLPVLSLATECFPGRIIFVGGEFEEKQKYTGGPLAELFLNQLKANKTFVAAGGISMKDGVTDYDITGAAVSKKFINRAEETIILADHSKFGISTFAHICDYKDISMIITNRELALPWEEKLLQEKVEILIANKLFDDINV